MNYQQRREVFELRASRDFLQQAKFKAGYEIGLRSVAPLMAIFWGLTYLGMYLKLEMEFSFLLIAQLISNLVITIGVIIAAAYWARKRYGLYLKCSFYWSFFWRLQVRTYLFTMLAVLLLVLLVYIGFNLEDIVEVTTLFVVPLIQMLAIGHAVAPAYWLSVRGIPVEVLVTYEWEIDDELESLMEYYKLGKGSWNKKNALSREQTLKFKQDHPVEAFRLNHNVVHTEKRSGFSEAQKFKENLARERERCAETRADDLGKKLSAEERLKADMEKWGPG